MLYSVGFVIATGCLHGVGISIGVVHRWVWGHRGIATHPRLAHWEPIYSNSWSQLVRLPRDTLVCSPEPARNCVRNKQTQQEPLDSRTMVTIDSEMETLDESLSPRSCAGLLGTVAQNTRLYAG
jgi:hypothetical protein